MSPIHSPLFLLTEFSPHATGNIPQANGESDRKYIENVFLSLQPSLSSHENHKVYCQLHVEKTQSRGRVDCVLETKDYVYIFEFKLDGTAAEALQQIEDKGYATPYQTDTRKVTAIGVSFSSETMTVEEWEEKTL